MNDTNIYRERGKLSLSWISFANQAKIWMALNLDGMALGLDGVALGFEKEGIGFRN